MSTVRRLSTIVCMPASTLSTYGHSCVKGHTQSKSYTDPWLPQAQQIHIEDMRRLDTNVNLIINPKQRVCRSSVSLPSSHPPPFRSYSTSRTTTSILSKRRNTKTTRYGQSGKPRKPPLRFPSPSLFRVAKSIHATVVIRGRAYPRRVIDNEEHGNFVKLRQMPIHTNMEDLREYTTDVLYENWRSESSES